MINTNMRLYNYYQLGAVDEYGQQKLPAKDSEPLGTIKMAIEVTAQGVQDNINYKDANYVGLTNSNVDDTYIIVYEGKRLKVLYVNPKGRVKQVYLKEI